MKEVPSFCSQECSDQACGFRFPEFVGKEEGSSCPKCGAPLDETKAEFYGRHHVNHSLANPTFEMHVLLDNIRSVYNVGSVFRTAEAVGVEQLHLCGMTATPEHPKLAKTAIGAEKTVPWGYASNAIVAAEKLMDAGFSLWAIEGGERAISLFDVDLPKPNAKIGLVLGNELAGVDPALLTLCERVLYIPMLGGKESLNITVAFGIAVYHLQVYSGSG